MLLLATSSGDNLRWQAGTQYVIGTRDGHVTHTVGFAHNLDGFQGPIPDSKSVPPERGGPYHYLYDMVDMGKYGVFASCAQHDAGAEQIVIIGVAHDTRHIVEDCKAKHIALAFQQRFLAGCRDRLRLEERAELPARHGRVDAGNIAARKVTSRFRDWIRPVSVARAMRRYRCG
jgi:hypothetical protein